MDPLSQGVLGASAPQSFSDRRHVRMACVLGFFGGMAPDLDIFIRSPTDPLLFLEYHRQFTHALVFIPIGGLISQNKFFTRVGLAWAILYLVFGVVQRERAASIGEQLAASRGHNPVRLEAKPGFANLFLWKIVYETENRFYVDAVRVGIDTVIFDGESIEKLDLNKHFPWLEAASQQARDIERFRWFSDGYLAVDESQDNFIVDVRYSILPNEIDALWGIKLSKNAAVDEHVKYLASRDASNERVRRLLEMVFN